MIDERMLHIIYQAAKNELIKHSYQASKNEFLRIPNACTMDNFSSWQLIYYISYNISNAIYVIKCRF